MENQYSEQQQKMQDAFGVFIDKCLNVATAKQYYYDVRPIDECLTDIYEEETKLYDFTKVQEFDDVASYLQSNGQYQQLIADVPEYADVVKSYRDFLVAYQYSQILLGGNSTGSNTNGLNKNIIVFGAPGTGKSHYVSHNYPGMKEENTTRTTFHPDTDYSTFVGCYKPTKDANGEITYEFVPQAFVEAYVNAWTRPDYDSYYLCIEEINRGNCAQIFGDIFQLLDRETDGMSSYKITPDRDLQTYLAEAFANADDNLKIPEEIKSGKKMQLPKNLWILATMNTSDQSLFPMDSAFKRRWSWKYIPIRDEGKDFVIDINGTKYDWWDFLEKVNKKIAKLTMSEDKQIGYWFVKVDNSGIINADTFVNKVLFYLWSDVFKDFINDGASPFTQKVGKDVTKQTFRSFVRNNGNLNFEEINRFLQHGVEISPNADEEEEAIEQGASGSFQSKGKKKQYLSVTFSDGQKYDGNNASQVLKDVIEDVGIERVLELGITHAGCPLIAKSLEEITEKYRKSAANHQLSNGMYLFTTTSNTMKKDDLERIARELNLTYTVELFTKD